MSLPIAPVVAATVSRIVPASQAAKGEHVIAPPAPLGTALPDEGCLAETICAVKNRMRRKSAGWSPSYCRFIAKNVLRSSSANDLSPALLVAVMLNESDLDEHAVATHLRGGEIYAKDSGLMGIRCLPDKAGHCTNGHVKKFTWQKVMDPATNIELGARELARWREGGAVMAVDQRVRQDGKMITKRRMVPCTHHTHAYWAHYNHGPRYIDHGTPRHYPHRIAVLYYALARAMNMDVSELRNNRLTINDPGLRPRTADRPVEERYRRLCAMIQDTRGICSNAVAVRASAPIARPN